MLLALLKNKLEAEAAAIQALEVDPSIDSEEISKRIKALNMRCQAIEQIDEMLAPGESYWALYQDLKPSIISISVQVIDELLSLMLEIASKTKVEEVLIANARMCKAVYESYLAVGFSEEQAFALLINEKTKMDSFIKKTLNEKLGK